MATADDDSADATTMPTDLVQYRRCPAVSDASPITVRADVKNLPFLGGVDEVLGKCSLKTCRVVKGRVVDIEAIMQPFESFKKRKA